MKRGVLRGLLYTHQTPLCSPLTTNECDIRHALGQPWPLLRDTIQPTFFCHLDSMDVNQHDCWFVACRFVHSFAIQYESVVKNKSDDLNTFLIHFVCLHKKSVWTTLFMLADFYQ